MEAATARLGRRPGEAPLRKSGSGASRRRCWRRRWWSSRLVGAYPIGYAIWLSLNEYSVRVPGLSRWAGFGNYSEALGSSEFWEAFQHNVHLHGDLGDSRALIGIGMALAMHEAFKGRGLLRAVVLVPWAVLTVVTAITWRTIFEPNLGLAPQAAGHAGTPGCGRSLARREGLRLSRDGARGCLEDGALHGAAATGRTPGDLRRISTTPRRSTVPPPGSASGA